ncbi:MAG: hypothetical protein LBL47_02440, partial [Lactobacillus sp.]|nr:hypothetical protein [Lactobacillus sp.]
EFELAKKTREVGASGGSDKEADAIVKKLIERVQKRDRNAKLMQVVLRSDMVTVKYMIKNTSTDSLMGLDRLAPLDSEEGVERINNAIAKQYEKKTKAADKRADRESINAEKANLQENIDKENKRVRILEKELGKKIEWHLKNLSGIDILAAMAYRDTRSLEVSDILSGCANLNEMKKAAVKALKNEKKIWDYVEEARYYDRVKRMVNGGYDKDSLFYKAMSKPLKELITIREKELYGLKNPGLDSVREMNSLLEEHGYRIDIGKINVSDKKKPAEFEGKTTLEISRMVLRDAETQKDKVVTGKDNTLLGEAKELAPYQRRYMTLGLMCAIGEGGVKNDDIMLFRKYMEVFFDKTDFSSVDVLKLQKQYAWDAFKKNNEGVAKAVYKDIYDNAPKPDKIKDDLLKYGAWHESNIHHGVPRRYAVFSSDPNELNNQPNLAVTRTWNGWEDDKHDLRHFFDITANDVVSPYLTKEKGEFVRKGDSKKVKELYFEKPQVKKDGKWVDLIPDDTLFISSTVTIAAPKLPNEVKHLALDCFKPIESLDILNSGLGKGGNGGNGGNG